MVFGGPSAEHAVSAASALAVIRALRTTRFRPVAIGIDRDGRWRLLPAHAVEKAVAARPDGPAVRDGLTVEGIQVELRHNGCLVSSESPAEVIERLDVVFPVMHGPYGEDGVIQGYLEALDMPYVGSGVGASAVGMDKVAMRRAFAAEGLPVVPGTWYTRRQWLREDPLTAAGGLSWPRFTKPARMGSSIGVSRVTGPAELARAVAEAFRYDDVVLVEEGITARELLCGVIGDADEAEASVPSELKVAGGFSDYAQKYLTGATVNSPADVPADVAAEVRTLSLRAFHAIGGYGLARVDFLYDEAAGRLYIGEINTMPGFTARSVFARGWAESGLPYTQLLERLLDLAFARHALGRDRARHPEFAAGESR
ncbi:MULTISPECIES: D-alanine--D-alanine ligase family protein [unclassified Streptomyces]|uniref:D-alanine--D-alanine ligase family protein n=1 Tax=unclassified Streptomyces TaxID=2593676 RepID=UPI003D8F1A8D